ncbi:MAG: CHAT domain-containing protein [Cyanobacteria bacterium P01_D01_bin.50]
MNEARLQAYLQLIQSLLGCPSSEELQQVLAANQELLDTEFLRVVTNVAEHYAQEGDENTAEWLRSLAAYLTPENTPITEADIQIYGGLLKEVVRTIIDSKGREVIYRLLAANTDKLNPIFAELLRRWATNTLTEAEADTATYIALIIETFSILIEQFSLGNKADNMEIAITGYEILLGIYTRTASPKDCARTQNNLGNAYLYRILGERSQNLEKAIAANNAALEFYTRTNFPEQWATLQNNLGNAYRERILGQKADNIEKAIAAYKAALEFCTRTTFPEEWATLQNNLGNAYGQRILGERADNLEKVIAAYSAALEVRIRTAFPVDWATTQNNLGNAYRERILGKKADNLEKAIAAYSAALEVRTRTAFPVNWATTQHELGSAYRERISGERADNLEKAINAYSAALDILTCADFPVDWAMTQHNLGNAYAERIFGERADNLEKAIAAYSAALDVYTRTDFPQQWAMTQDNLGITYRDRILGERADNLEKAIAACSAALDVYTRTDFPQQWAMTQNNLGVAYAERILEERADNLEKAIAAHSAALDVLTCADFPQKWAMTQNNLGTAYAERILGERADNLEKALAAYSAALDVYTRIDFPEQWAATQNNLGITYRDRILGERTDNLEKSIGAYNAALSVRTRNAFPVDWAMTQNNLGITYRDRILGERADNLEKAIRAYNAALSVRTRNAFPVDWAMTQNNLGNAYAKRIVGERADNLEKAIAAYSAAFDVYTRPAFPVDWAMMQNNLGVTYRNRILGERADNLKKAIVAYNAALSVRTPIAFPQDNAVTLLNLGILYQEEQKFDLAKRNFSEAIATVEGLRGEILSGEEVKRKQAEEWNRLYCRMVEVCLALGRNIEAIEYIERSKTRNLVELILNRDQQSIFPPELVTQIKALNDKIATSQYQLQNNKAPNPTALAQDIQQWRQQRQELQDSYLPVGSGFKFDQFINTLDRNTAIIEWYIASDSILTFIIQPQEQLTCWQSSPADREALVDWANTYLRDYYKPKDKNKNQWQNKLETRLQQLSEILHIEEIILQLPQECERLILIPHRFLHLFPLHALPFKASYLIDLFPKGISYAPSLQILQQVQLRQRDDFQSLFAIQNPTEDLYFTDLEVENISSYFSSHQILAKKQATKFALFQAAIQLKQANYLHFSCHGSFNVNSPQNSFLLLADAYVSPIPANANPERYLKVSDTKAIDLNKCLTLGNLFERTFDFSQTRLVVISACETGLIDFKNTSDEYIGLPSGFIYAGSSSVVSSLWTVDDLSTSLLTIKFIQNLQAVTDTSVPLAMNQAQRWLRNANVKDLLKWSKESKLNQNIQQEIQDEMETYNLEEKRFSSPFHWAAFCAIGQ